MASNHQQADQFEKITILIVPKKVKLLPAGDFKKQAIESVLKKMILP